MDAQPKYWFPAKRYGWGWGLPQTWQGWVVMGVFVALNAVTGILISPISQPVAFAVSFTLLAAVLIAICWFKGEPPRWRWGDSEFKK